MPRPSASRRPRGKVVTRVTDVGNGEAVAALVAAGTDAFGRLDVALNNAGVAHATMKLVDTDEALMRRMLDVNVMGVFHGMKAEIPVMERQGGGVILNTASVAGITGAPLLAAYAAAKHAVIGLPRRRPPRRPARASGSTPSARPSPRRRC